MLEKPNEMGEILDSKEFKGISKLSIHLGLCLGESPSNMTEQWTQCLTSVLREVRPFILHLNHNGNNSDLSEDTKETLNGQGFIIQPQQNQWIIWQR